MSHTPFRQIPSTKSQPSALGRILEPIKHDLELLMGTLGSLRALTTADLTSGTVLGAADRAALKKAATGLPTDVLTQADLANGTLLGKGDLTAVNQAIGDLSQALSRINSLGYIPPPAGIPESDLDAVLANKIERVQTFTYEQTRAATRWMIAHNLGRYPAVDVIDTAGAIVVGAVSYPDANTVEIDFSAAFAGTAYLN